MRVLVRVLMRVDRSVCVRVFMLMGMTVGVLVLMIVNRMGMFVSRGMPIAGFYDDIDFGSGEAAASDLTHRKACADVQVSRSPFQQGERDAYIDQSAKQHVAANAGKAIQIGNSHREKL